MRDFYYDLENHISIIMFTLHTHLKYKNSMKQSYMSMFFEFVDEGLRMSSRRRKNGKDLFNGTCRTYT